MNLCVSKLQLHLMNITGAEGDMESFNIFLCNKKEKQLLSHVGFRTVEKC
jgi:hypothetical protein